MRWWYAFSATVTLFFGVLAAFRAIDRSEDRARAAEHKLSQCDDYVSGRDEPVSGTLIWFHQTGELRIQVGPAWLGMKLTKEGATQLSKDLDEYLSAKKPDAGLLDGGSWL